MATNKKPTMKRSRAVRLTPKRLLAAFLGLLALASSQPTRSAPAAIFTVTRTDDPAPDGCAVNGCSLREAIIDANASDSADSIVLPSGTYTLTRTGAGEESASTGDLDIRDDLTITGSGPTSPVIDASDLDRVIHIIDPTFAGMQVTINGVVLQNGTVNDSGGGIWISTSATLTLNNSTVRDNRSEGNNGGGGLYVQGSAELRLINSTVSNNVATSHNGGGITSNSTLTVINSTISGNTTVGQGGGIYNNIGPVYLANVTVANNQANGGGGVVNAPGTTLTLKHTILADNRNDSQQPSDCGGTLTSDGYNLIESVAGCTISGVTTGTITGQDGRLGPLQANGGPTQTHALMPGSPAVDAGDPAGCRDANSALLPFDQRGAMRPIGSRCDLGAYEARFAYLALLQR